MTKSKKCLSAGIAMLILAGCNISNEKVNGQEVKFDKGGVTFDFEKISQERFKPTGSNMGENLISNGDFEAPLKEKGTGRWIKSKAGVHIGDKALVAKLKPQVIDLPVLEIVKTESGKAAKTLKPLEIEKICGSKTRKISASWIQMIKLPDESGGRYKLNFRYKGKVAGKFGGVGCAIINFKDNSGKRPSLGKRTRKLLVAKYPEPKSKWQSFSTDFEAPAKTAWLTLYLRFDGTGEIFFDNVELRKIKEQQPVTVKLMPMSLLDNTFALSEGNPAIMNFVWRRNIPKKDWKITKPFLCVELPNEIELKSVWKNLKIFSTEDKTINGKKFKTYKIDLSLVRKRPEQLSGFDHYLAMSLLIFTNAKAETELPTAAYWIEDEGKTLSKKETFALKVIPQIKINAKPEIFMNGFSMGGRYMNFTGKDNAELLGRFIGKTGSRWIVGKPENELTGAYRKNGIKIITPGLHYIANGYRIGKPSNKPDYAKFKSISKASHKDIARGTCPVAIYTESDFFKESVLPYIKEELKGFDGLWANWEPYMFNGRGCFCERCRDEFIKFSKLPEDEIKTAWPNEMLVGKKYHETWVKFRAWQHAKMVKVINKAVNESTTGKAGFVPGIAWVFMSDSKAGQDASKEFNILNYGSDFKYIDPWGPYPCWKASEPYSYQKGANLRTFIAAIKVREFTNRNFKEPKRPRLLAFPHGLQGGTWVTQPEAIAMDVISFFLNQYEGSTVYHFPRGYDNRFWTWQAKANELIAKYEQFVFNGEHFNGFEATPETPYPAPLKKVLPRYFPECLNTPLIQTVGFKLKEKYLAAVGNFWEKGEVFFKLKIKGLEKNKEYVVRNLDSKRYFAGNTKDSFSGSELENGITLQAGALRWAFYVIEAYRKGADYGEKITQEQVKDAAKHSSLELRKAFRIEQELTAKEEAENSKSDLRKITNGKLSCVPVETGDEQALKFASGKSELLLKLDGMTVRSWKVNGKELVGKSPKLGLGTPAFWEPPAMFTVPYQVKKLAGKGSGIIVIAERFVSRKLNPLLEHLTIRQEIEIGSGCESINIKTTLINSSSDETGPRDITAGFRYHFMPQCLADNGSITMTDSGKAVVFKRKFERALFAKGKTESAEKMKKLFSISGSPINITSPEAVMAAPSYGFKIDIALSPAGLFAGFACWDEPKQTTSSFEAFFKPVTIKPQKSASFEMSLKVVK